tara:strand:+ start:157 stop:861 length:705 start_codon:yes stop_codon:yes gene_type:complete
MNENSNFETYLLVSPKKFLISLKKKDNFENIYQQEKNFKNNFEILKLNELNEFLNDNIYKAEKYLDNFIKDIILILDCNHFFQVQLSLKMNNHGDLLEKKNLDYLLNEAKNQCRNTLRNKKIIHVTIDNYSIDDKIYNFMPQNLNCNFFSIDVSFICLPIDFLKTFEAMINKYQISINRIISYKYITELFLNKNLDIIKMTKDTIDGYNQNEVVLVAKKLKNEGFFEKFFHFFN